jgi:tetratricopeptide (TPR) repeat protein
MLNVIAAVALKYIEEAIAHTPTVLDLYVVQARIYKHAGAIEEAARKMDKARELDLADRYLNTRATRALLRANMIERAERVIALFTTVPLWPMSP